MEHSLTAHADNIRIGIVRLQNWIPVCPVALITPGELRRMIHSSALSSRCRTRVRRTSLRRAGGYRLSLVRLSPLQQFVEAHSHLLAH